MIVLPLRYTADVFDFHGRGDIIIVDDDGDVAFVMRPVGDDDIRGFRIVHPGDGTPPPDDDGDPNDPDPGEALTHPLCELAA